ncbi:MAG: dephospho-CoA kinase [Leptospiraceae bacterium]|nr:dephospho-CoA kinase [Leptospiraceae bacterium]MCP5501625.1 dephospho-CoA kinase [Leptospiraceae bacterium]
MLKTWKERFVLGITGIIGSGKSSVSKLMEELGAFRINADELARFYSSEKSPILKDIEDIVGVPILDEKGSPDRKIIASIVFSEPQKLKALNDLIHPLVRKEAINLIESQTGGRIVVYEVPLLFESGADALCDATLTVAVEESIAQERVQKRDGMNESEFRARLSKQMNLKKKLELSDFIINNNGDLSILKKECENIYHTINQYKGLSE